MTTSVLTSMRESYCERVRERARRCVGTLMLSHTVLRCARWGWGWAWSGRMWGPHRCRCRCRRCERWQASERVRGRGRVDACVRSPGCSTALNKAGPPNPQGWFRCDLCCAGKASQRPEEPLPSTDLGAALPDARRNMLSRTSTAAPRPRPQVTSPGNNKKPRPRAVWVGVGMGGDMGRQFGGARRFRVLPIPLFASVPPPSRRQATAVPERIPPPHQTNPGLHKEVKSGSISALLSTRAHSGRGRPGPGGQDQDKDTMVAAGGAGARDDAAVPLLLLLRLFPMFRRISLCRGLDDKVD